MAELNLTGINEDVLRATGAPKRPYYAVMALLAATIAWGAFAWMYQIRVGLRIAGISIPVGWAVYIANFVFWVGIAHSGTLISAILHLVRSRWRDSVSRSAEAMTIFAILTAGLFPMIHLGRVWVVYYILPYPSERRLWPNFMSPLVWDVVAVSTYLTVSVIFFYVGLIPDLASARDHYEAVKGKDHPKSRLYRLLALGWYGAGSQWHHYGRSYLFFAALATPLVISVHSVVSWDFAMSLLPGWHTTIYAPYFVAGAIHSGLAMVLILLIPMRRLLKLEKIITVGHLEACALTMLVTTAVIGYAYMVEPATGWFSGNIFERQYYAFQATGWTRWLYWLEIPLNVLFPLCFVFPAVRRSLRWLFVVSFGVVAGMWIERLCIVAGATSHDFMPHNWAHYAPRWPEYSITIGAFAWFLFWFFGFSKLLPTIPMAELKAQVSGEKPEMDDAPEQPIRPREKPEREVHAVRGIFADPGRLVDAVKTVYDAGFGRLETFSPIKLDAIRRILNRPKSPARLWTLGGALAGLAGGFWLAIGSAHVNNLVVGGKLPVSIIPYCVIGFEGTILLGTVAGFAGLIVHTRLYRLREKLGYDPRFSRDKFGLLVSCRPEELDRVKEILSSLRPDELSVLG